MNNDLSYIIQTKYLGKGDAKVFEEKGKFEWDTTGSTIKLKALNGQPSQYKVGENKLIQLDMDGKIISGSLADKYLLLKE